MRAISAMLIFFHPRRYITSFTPFLFPQLGPNPAGTESRLSMMVDKFSRMRSRKMMFQATLLTVASQLDDARKTTQFAIAQLGSIHSLTWNSKAGKAFLENVDELSRRLEMLNSELGDAEEYVGVAMREIQNLEAQIMNQRMAS
ncbi:MULTISPECIES: hypothetical protein [Glutamicibacter]|uniref:hypothetical protein n=2 Tax=Glutamicibacter TaxID=1742989 RepID=UPI0013CE9059|nr:MULTISPECIES: hypothetical protein [Glutamicibacter]UTM46127.1 hypothetical protein XH9_11190 [Glutamicibacter mysorens]